MLKGKPPLKRIKDQKYYMENVDIEAEIMIKATQIAEKMVAAMMREQARKQSIEVDIDLDDLAERIASKIGGTQFATPVVNQEVRRATDQFSFDDEPTIMKIDDLDIKGGTTKKTNTKESTDDALDALMDLDL